MNGFVRNGFIVKAYEELYENKLERYEGIARYLTWPLDVCKDHYAQCLVEEAMERWLGYQDNRPQVIPDSEYIIRYVEHCTTLGISVFCLQVESQNSIIRADDILKVHHVLGYDYVDIDMCTSCLYDDLCEKDYYYLKYFKEDGINLNAYGLFSNMNHMMQYLFNRNKMLEDAFNIEKYISPMIVRLSKIKL